MRRAPWLVPLAAALLIGPWSEAATAPGDRVELDVQYAEAFERGAEAFRRGDLNEAASAFQEAWLIQPTNPRVVSWLSLVRDEQARRAAMTRTLEEVQHRPPPLEREQEPLWFEEAWAEPGTTGEGEGEPLAERLALPAASPVGLDRLVTPLKESRPEILSETKRSGFQRLYKEGIGFQPIRGLGFSARTEIFEEPNPVEDYLIESKILNFTSIADYRRSITPLFTRSWAARVVADYEPWPRLTYEFDNRDVEHEFETRFGFKNRHLETHAVNALYTFPRAPLLGSLTVNPWYKRVIQESDQDAGTFEDRDEFILNLSLQPTDDLEYFFQFDTYESVKTRTLGASKLRLFKGQVRMRFPSLRLFVIPSAEYSDTDYDPSDDEFAKRDFFVDWGFDITKRLRASSKEQIITAETSQPGKVPSNPDAEVFNTFNTLSYELFPDFDVSFGMDYSRGAGLNAFNNVGFRVEAELFKPGIIRSKIGYEWLSYYNIDDTLSLIYWRLFLFQ